jgi:hypothetical protein
MVQKSILSLIRKAARLLLCASPPQLSESHDVWRDQPGSPSSTRVAYGSISPPSSRHRFYVHRNRPIALTERTTPTTKYPSSDQKVAPDIEEWMRREDSAKKTSKSDKSGLNMLLRRPSEIVRGMETRISRRTHQKLMDWPQVEHGYIRKIAETDITTLQAAKKCLMAMYEDVNTAFHQWKETSARELEAKHHTLPAGRSARHSAPESQQRIGHPVTRAEILPSSRADTQPIAAAPPLKLTACHNVRDLFRGVMTAWVGRIALRRSSQWVVDALK